MRTAQKSKIFLPSQFGTHRSPSLRLVLRSMLDFLQTHDDDKVLQVLKQYEPREARKGVYRWTTRPNIFPIASSIFSIWKEKYEIYNYDYFTFSIAKFLWDKGVIPTVKIIQRRVYFHEYLLQKGIMKLNDKTIHFFVALLEAFKQLPTQEKIKYTVKWWQKARKDLMDDILPISKTTAKPEIIDLLLNIQAELPNHVNTKDIWGAVYEYAFESNLIENLLKEVQS